MMNELKVYQLKSLCKAHEILMKGLINNPGKLRNTSVGIRHNKDISPATASRDLKEAVNDGILKKTGDKRLTKYKFMK